MLRNLKVCNYALIKQLEMDFTEGFCVITGETGAGKSILLGALGLVLGQRADASALFDKTRKCVVEAVFDAQDADFSEFFETHDLDWNPAEVILRREVLPAGKSRAFINDTPVTLSVMKELGSFLVDIHSQHETLLLNRASFQLKLVDSYLSDPNRALPDEYRMLYREYEKKARRLEQLKQERDKAQQERDYHKFLYEELSSARLKDGEQAEMERDLEVLEHAQDLAENFSQALHRLEGEPYGILPALKETVKALKKAAVHHTALSEALPRWESLLVELEDLKQDVQRFEDNIESDPHKKQLCQERLDTLYRLEKKHRVESDTELIALARELESKILLAENAGEEIESLEQETAQAEKVLAEKALALRAARQTAAAALQKAILAALADLGMEQSRLEAAFTPLERYTPDGLDKVTFLFSANLGAETGEIAKVASGGELSRLMLAVKSVIHQGSLLGTLVLDEIDTGVSGSVAGKVAGMMKNLGRCMQVIAITHLPQIAAAARTHYYVYKNVEDNASVSHMRKLNDSEHVESIASMLSNSAPTDASRRAAEELIKG